MNHKIEKSILVLFLFVLNTFSIMAKLPETEVRATWLATVWRIDWPSEVIKETGNEKQMQVQKKQLTRILDSLKVGNMNAVYFQVRARSDAFYKSSYEPWSSDLVSTRGMDPGYDPLAYIVEEGHKRGIEIYAWVNPYRFESSTGQWKGQAGDYASTHPDWILDVNNATILNPGMPEVRKHITSIIAEIVHNYDIDGLIFDDYFYLSGIDKQDLKQQNQYNTSGMDVGDWRRQNVNTLVRQVYDTIQTIKPYVKFGVGPAGIFGGGSKTEKEYDIIHPAGIGSGYAYNSIFCDPLAWLSGGYIDFISPQIYWTIGSNSTDFDVLCEWWAKIAHKYHRYFFTSHSLSAMTTSPELSQAMRMQMQRQDVSGLSQLERNSYLQKENLSDVSEKADPLNVKKKTASASSFGFNEICNQIELNRKHDLTDAPGCVFYSTKSFLYNGKSVNYISGKVFSEKALPPAVFWKQNKSLSDIRIENITKNSNTYSWNCDNSQMRYAVYAIENNVSPMIKHLVTVSYEKSVEIPQKYQSSNFKIGIAPLDRFGNQGVIYTQQSSSGEVPNTSLTYPETDGILAIPSYLTWNDVGAEQYYVELSEDSSFKQLYDRRQVTKTQIASTRLFPLTLGKTYYWRVRSRKAGMKDGLSEVRNFTVKNFEILSPENGTEDMEQTPTITWNSCPFDISYTVQIATQNSFGKYIVFEQIVKGNSFTIPSSVLTTNTNYYVRVIADLDGNLAYSSAVGFKTLYKEPNIPVLLTPQENHVSNGTLTVSWVEETAASGFRIELCMNDKFPARDATMKRKEVEAFNYSAEFSDLKDGIWYIRCRSNYGSKSTDWTPVRSFTVNTLNSIKTGYENVKPKILNHNGKTLIAFTMDDYGAITIEVYSSDAKKVKSVLWNQYYMPGNYVVPVNNLINGIYVIKIQMNNKHFVMKYLQK